MEKLFRVDRRTTLAWFSGAALAGVSLSLAPSVAGAQDAGGSQVAPGGYGMDPDLQHPSTPWPRTMSARQLQLTAALADLILPPTATAPAPSAVGIPDFVDEWVSAPYPDQQRDRALVLPGLLWLDTEAGARWGKPFTDLAVDRRLKLLTALAMPPASADPAAAARYGFFRRFRSIAVGAYYSLERNFAEIGYIGNVPLQAFPPPTEQEIAFIDKAITELGL